MFAATLVVLWATAMLPPAPTQLLLEFQPSPVMGVDTLNPRVSWAVPDAPGRGTTTVGYSIVVVTLAGGPVCSTGHLVAHPWLNSSVGLGDLGCQLAPDTGYRWSARVWQTNDESSAVLGPSPFSAAASFHVGLLALTDWHGAVSIAAGPPPPPPPPTPPPHAVPHCLRDCKMVPTPGGYHSGQFNETQVHNVGSIPDCERACLNDPACVQITWAPSHGDKCVMYQSITATMVGGAQGWVKCSSTATGPGCAAAPPAPPPPPRSPAHVLRLAFTPPAAIGAATLYLSAVGWADAYLNGPKVANCSALNPGRTSFDVRQWYMAYNVTSRLVGGERNVLGIVLAAGWQSMPGHKLSTRAVLSITDARTGKKTYVVTAPGGAAGWTATTDGPVTEANIYAGEAYDARKELPGWATAGYNPGAPAATAGVWGPAVAVAEFPRVVPSWQPMQPIRALELNPALSITTITLTAAPAPVGVAVAVAAAAAGQLVYVYKFPQNAAGTVSIALANCPANTTLQFWYSENLCGYGTTRWSPPCPVGLAPGNGQFGTIDQRNYRTTELSSYTCRGATAESYEPAFTYTGFRYVEVHGHGWATPDLGTVRQRVIHSDVEAAPLPVAEQQTPRALAGSIVLGRRAAGGAVADSAVPVPPAIDGPSCYEGENCDAERPVGVAAKTAVLDQISHNVRWDLIDNLHSVPEDCDQRNERWGWMADASVSAEGNYQYHWMPALYTSWLTSMRDVQTEPTARCAAATGVQGDTNVVDGKPECLGAVGDLTPGTTPASLPGDPSWMFAYPLVFSYQFRYFGDVRLADKLWVGIQAYADFLAGMAGRGKTGLVSWKKYGDWLEPGKVASLDIIGEMSSSFNYGQTLRIARDTAGALGDVAAQAKYAAAFVSVQAAFHKVYYSPAKKTYGDGTQAALTYALYLEAAPTGLVDQATFAELVRVIYAGTKECDSTPCVDTGILATKWLMELLSLRGRTDVGLDLAFKTDFPSWGYMAAMNATTVWEHWEYMNGAGMNSHAHPALASVGAWFYRWVAGLRLDDGTLGVPSDGYGKGWRRVRFAPGCVTDPRLPTAAARVSSPFGPIAVGWANQSGSGSGSGSGGTLAMTVSLPADVAGTVVVPPHVGGGPAVVTVTEGGACVWKAGAPCTPGAPGVTAAIEDGAVTLKIGSGSYAFAAR